MTVPNILTLFRILLTPLLIWLLLDARLAPALLVFFVAGMTDGLDGLLARLLNQRSKLGAYLDPLADKLLLVSSFLLLGRLGLIPNWLVVIAVSRDAVITLGLITLMFHQVPVQIRPTIDSKATTVFELATVLSVLGSPFVGLPALLVSFLFVCTAALCVVSTAHYVKIGIGLYEDSRANNTNSDTRAGPS
jgi:cardiolipin synthase